MQKIQVDDFMKVKYLSSLTYSPDGSKIAYVISNVSEDKKGYESNLRLIQGKDDKAMINDGKVGQFYFEDNDHILFASERGKDKDDEEPKDIKTVLYRLPLNGGEAEKAYELPLNVEDIKFLGNGDMLLKAETLVDYPDLYLMEGEKRKAVLETLKDEKDYEVLTQSPFFANGVGFISGRRTSLYLYSKANGKLKRLTEKYMDIGNLVVNGKDVYFSGVSFRAKMPKFEGIYHLDLETLKVERILKPMLMVYDIGLVDGKLMICGTDGKKWGDNQDPWFYTLDLKTGELKVICEADDNIEAGIIGDIEYGGTRFIKTEGKYMYFPSIVRDRCVLKRVGLDGEIETVISKEGSVNDYDIFGDNVVFMGMFGQDLPEVFIKDGARTRRVTSWNREVFKDCYVAKPKALKTQVGEETVDGWVLLPEDFDENGKYPAILDIHGGPKCAYGTIYFHEMQYWVNKGYVVMYCNPHGSNGKGNAYASLDMRWGGIDYEHIMAFVDNVLDKYPAIDTKRVCCTGGSYGGYMSNWIMGHTDRFCAIATQRSISNWVTMYGVSDIPPIACGETCNTDPYSEKGIKQMWDVSPLKYVNNAKTPTLFIHSDEDHRCPIEEGYQLFTALVYKGVPAKMVVFHGENHELSRTGKPHHKLRRLNEITGWFDKYTK